MINEYVKWFQTCVLVRWLGSTSRLAYECDSKIANATYQALAQIGSSSSTADSSFFFARPRWAFHTLPIERSSWRSSRAGETEPTYNQDVEHTKAEPSAALNHTGGWTLHASRLLRRSLPRRYPVHPVYSLTLRRYWCRVGQVFKLQRCALELQACSPVVCERG